MKESSVIRCSWSLGAWVVLFILASQSFVSAQTNLVTRRNPAVPYPLPDYQDSVSPSISADGRFVLFVSTAKNLVPGDNSQFGANLFLRDRSSNTTTLVSVNLSATGGCNGQCSPGVLSTNGRYVLFESDASDLVPGDTNGANDVFIRDLIAGTTTLVSVSTNGGPGNLRSSDAVMTPDGRYVAFISSSSNLVAGDTNALPDIFVRDLVAQTTTLVSVGANVPSPGSGQVIMATPLISTNGRYVTFFSSARGLVAGMTTWPGDIFQRDVVGGTTRWVSTNLSTTQNPMNSPSFHPAMSSDGRFIAFKYGLTNTMSNSPGPTIFLYDSVTASNTAILTDTFALGGADADDIFGPTISADGRFIAYTTNVSGSPNQPAVCMFDVLTGSNTLVSIDPGSNQPNTPSHTPVITPDGRFVAFLSTTTYLMDIGGGTGPQPFRGLFLYLRDLQAGTNRQVDVYPGPSALTDVRETIPTLSDDGRYVAFSCPSVGVAPQDTIRAYEAFVRDMSNSNYDWISARDPAVQSQSASKFSYMSQRSLSKDGRRIAFTSFAADLVTNDFNGFPDVYVRDIPSGSNFLVSVGTDGNAGAGSSSYNPLISANGRYVAFLSSATNLTPTNLNYVFNLYLRDLETGTTVMVSSNITQGPPLLTGNDVSSPAMSEDGRYLIYIQKQSPSGDNGFSLVRYDAVLATRTSVATNVLSTADPSISADGRYVAFVTNVNNRPMVWDAQTESIVYTNNSPVVSSPSVALSPSGTRFASLAGGGLTVVDFSNGSNLLTYPAIGTIPVIKNSSVWSDDARFFVYGTSMNGSVPPTNAILLHDFQTGSEMLVSRNSNSTGNANGFGDQLAISGDGRFVVYRHTATDIVPLAFTNSPNIYLFDRLTGLNKVLSGPSAAPYLPSKPVVNGNGSMAAYSAFLAAASPALDINRTADIFAASLLPWGTTDTDGDGIPDIWTQVIFGHDTGQAGDQSRAGDDPDGDGMTNLQEFLAGTNPLDAASVLRLTIVPVVAPHSVQLTWLAIPGKAYMVQYKNQLADSAWINIPGGASIAGSLGSYSVPADQSGRYYRVAANVQ